MAFEKIVTLNEFFVRMTDDASAIQGVHVADMERILEDGVLRSAKMLSPRAVDPGDVAALGVIATAFNTAALATVDAQIAQIAQMEADHAAALKTATDAQAAADAARNAALAQVDTLKARIAELEPPVIDGVPQEVAMWQAQTALLGVKLADGSSLLDKVEGAINAMTGDAGRAAQILWTKSAHMLRNNPLIAHLQGALGLSDAQIDALFIQASKLP